MKREMRINISSICVHLLVPICYYFESNISSFRKMIYLIKIQHKNNNNKCELPLIDIT